jgi:hypothetical protein
VPGRQDIAFFEMFEPIEGVEQVHCVQFRKRECYIMDVDEDPPVDVRDER